MEVAAVCTHEVWVWIQQHSVGETEELGQTVRIQLQLVVAHASDGDGPWPAAASDWVS